MEVSWNLETEALRVHDRKNVKRNLSMRSSGAACATCVGASDGEEVLICKVVTVASWLHVLDHEDIFLAERFHLSFNLSLSWSRVSDILQVNCKSSVNNVTMSSSNSFLGLVLKSEDLVVMVSSGIHFQMLFNVKRDMLKSNVTVLVVEVNMSSASFMRLKPVLVE